MKAWLLRLHRWVALVFALPLLFVLGSGLVLSFEPWLVERAIAPGSLDAARLVALLEKHDPAGQVRSVVYRSYDGTLTMSAGRRGGTIVDVASGQVREPSRLATTLQTVRRMHERLLIDAGWLVMASSAAMLVLALVGGLMGLPRLANTVSGWHKAMAWGLLPLVVLSPLTGLLLATGGGGGPRAPREGRPAETRPLKLIEAVKIAGERHDLSKLMWLRPQGGRVLLRLSDAGESRVFSVTREGTTAEPRNWTRLWHEGNFAGVWSALMNVVTSLAMLGLLFTGVWIWGRRRLRPRNRRRQAQAAAA